MGKENGRGKSRRRNISQARKFLNREGKKLCSAALCVSLLFGSVLNTTVAANKDTDDDGYEFELSRASLYQALQDAVLNGDTVDEDMEFRGSAAEEYSEMFAPSGSLYELKPEIEDNDGKVQLRVFAKLDQDIDLDSEYEAAGTEEIMFLLTNRSDEAQKAVIYMDDKYTEEIEVAPGKAIAVQEDETSQGPAGGGAGNGGGSSSGGSAAGGETPADTETTGPADEGGQAPDNGGAPTESQPEETTGTEDKDDVTTPDGATDPTEGDETVTDGNGETGDSADDKTDDSATSDNDNSTSVEDGDNENSGNGGDTENTGDTNTDSNNAENENQSGGQTGAGEGGSENTGDTENGGGSTENSDGGNSSTGGDSTASDGGSGSSGGDENDGSDNSGSDSGTTTAAISFHKASWVAAPVATDSDMPVATGSDLATNSDLEKLIDGELYEAVRLRENGAVAFVTTLDDLGVMDGWGPIVFGQKFEADIDGFRVRAIARKGVLPDDVQLEVEELREDDAQTADGFQEAKAALDATMVEEGSQYDGMMALDIKFVDENGDEIEPNGDVQVSIEVKEGKLPEDVDLETVKVHHLKEVGTDAVKVEAVADGAGETSGTVKSANEVVAELKDAQVPEEEIPAAVSSEASAVAAFSVDSFSYFTITWTYGNRPSYQKSIEVHLIDTTGTELPGGYLNEFDVSSRNTITISEKAPYVRNYTYQYAVIASNEMSAVTNDGIKTTKLKYTETKYVWKDWYGIPYLDEIEVNDVEYNHNDSDEWSSLGNLNVYLIYSEDTLGSGGGDGGSSDVKKPTPSISKKADSNNDGTYDLSLSVTGSVGSQSNTVNVDVLMVADTSGSMSSKMSDLKQAMYTLLDTMHGTEGVDARYSIVSFASDGQIKANWMSLPKTYDEVEDTDIGRIIGKLSATGGTNYMAGLQLAKGLLEASRENEDRDAYTVVVFLSDGKPTYYYNSHEPNADRGGDGNSALGINSKGWRLTVETADDIICNRFYSVGVGADMSTYLNTNSSNNGLIDVVNVESTDKDYLEAKNDGSDLATIFAGIAGSSLKLEIDTVTIKDQLNTQYVEIVPGTDGNAQLEVKVTDKNKVDVSEIEIAEGNIVAGYNKETSELSLNFDPDYKLKDHYTYTVTMKIQPNETAKQYYASNKKYPDTPTADVDTGTHSKETGFHSNVEAVLSYYNTNDDRTQKPNEIKYPKPVVQITVADLLIEKDVIGLSDEGIAELQDELSFEIYNNATGTGTPMARVSYKEFSDGSYTIKSLKPGKYTVKEVGYGDITDYTFKTPSADTSKTITVAVGEDNKVEFTNKYAKNMVIPTGIFTDKLPYLLMFSIAMICTAGAMFNSSVRRRHGRDEE